MRKLPRITVITPSFNQAAFLEQSILSVLDQHYPDLEYIIIDGGSSDGSVEIINKYAGSLAYWCSEKDSGQTEALNKGFRRATGEIVAWLNSDDFYCPNSLSTVADAYLERRFDFLVGGCSLIDEKGNFVRELATPFVSSSTLVRYWSPHFCPPQPSVFFRRECLNMLGELDERLHYAMDFDLWLKASAHYSFTPMRQRLSCYRVHSDSKTGSGIGLLKFVPEWRLVIKRFLRRQGYWAALRWRVQDHWFRWTQYQHNQNVWFSAFIKRRISKIKS